MDDATILTELRAMRSENKTDNTAIREAVDLGFKEVAAQYATHTQDDIRAFASIHARFTPLEEMHRSVKWVKRGALTLVATGVVDILVDHLPKWLKP